jgi:hypothetical protein
VTPIDLVQTQLDAYNAHDLECFLAVYSDDVRLFRPPLAEPVLSGKAALAEFYRERRFCIPDLHAGLVSRQASGSLVIDHERITGLMPQPVEAMLVFRVSSGLIAEVWAFDPAG